MHLVICSVLQLDRAIALQSATHVHSCEFVPQAFSHDELPIQINKLKNFPNLKYLALSRQPWTIRAVHALTELSQTTPFIGLQLSRNLFDLTVISMLAQSVSAMPALNTLGLSAINWSDRELFQYIDSNTHPNHSVKNLSLSLKEPTLQADLCFQLMTHTWPGLNSLILGADFINPIVLHPFLQKIIAHYSLKSLNISGSFCEKSWHVSSDIQLDVVIAKMLHGLNEDALAALTYLLQSKPIFCSLSHNQSLNNIDCNLIGQASLIALDLSHCQITTNALLSILSHYPSCFSLWLNGHYYKTFKEWSSLIHKCASLSDLVSLSLSTGLLSHESIEVFCDYIAHSKLTALILRDLSLSNESADRIIQLLRNTTITYCDLTQNGLPKQKIMQCLISCSENRQDLYHAIERFQIQPHTLSIRDHALLKNHLLSCDKSLSHLYPLTIRLQYDSYCQFNKYQKVIELIFQQLDLIQLPNFLFQPFFYDSQVLSVS
ncbi:MAG: hypothetical protein FJ161_01440 [Gammaproteobacteria bacterium]|nr:hypothetical protein [Gammaproteobacteria bacterium]